MDPGYVCAVLGTNGGGRFDPVSVVAVRVLDGGRGVVGWGGGVVGSVGGIACSEGPVGELALFASLGASFFCLCLSCGCADRLSRQLVPCCRLVPLAFLGLLVPPAQAGGFFHQTGAVNGSVVVVTGAGGGDVVVTADAAGLRPQRPERIALQASAARAVRSAGLSGPSGRLLIQPGGWAVEEPASVAEQLRFWNGPAARLPRCVLTAPRLCILLVATASDWRQCRPQRSWPRRRT
jgi:hypothetical protein